MSILEIIGELINHGPMGEIDFKDNNFFVKRKFILIRFVISLILIGIIEYLFLSSKVYNIDLTYIIKVNVILLIYFLVSHFIIVKPNYDNLGWVPFVVNNPFRYLDNLNRILVVVYIMFMPGKYISVSMVGFFRYLKSKERTVF